MGVSGESLRPNWRQGSGGRGKILKKGRGTKLGKQMYRRSMKRGRERAEWRCQKCGSREDRQVHHKIKRSQLGNDSLNNLVTPLCPMPRGRAWAVQLHHPSSPSVQEARTSKKVKMPAEISGVGNLLSLSKQPQFPCLQFSGGERAFLLLPPPNPAMDPSAHVTKSFNHAATGRDWFIMVAVFGQK